MPLTPTGFDRPRLPEIKSDFDQSLNDALGPVNTNPDSTLGQISGIMSEAFSNLNEVLQDTYDSMYPYSAEGTSLDGAVAFIGLERLAATPTIITAAAYGAEGTLLTAGQLSHIDVQYRSTSDVVISRANALDVNIEVNTVTNSATYQILAGGDSITFNSDSSATATEILNGLAALFDLDRFTATVANDVLRVRAEDGISPFSITVDSKLTITKRGSPIVFVAMEDGARQAPVGSLTSIDTPVLGWDELYNIAAGSTGRDRETDIELRARHAASTRGTGSATVEAIKARMLADVAGVTSIQIYENRTNITSLDGIPPHAFESVIVGGTTSAIGDQLWLTKPAGIETHGNVTVTVLDSAGDQQEVKFSRPVPQYAWLEITVDALNPEEVLPITAIAAIKQAAVDYANANIGVGDDIFIQRFYGPIYANVPGLGRMTIRAAITATEGGTPTYGTADITIGKAEIAVFDVSRVVVNGI